MPVDDPGVAAQLALAGNLVIAVAYAAITVAIAVPLVRGGRPRSNPLAVGTALIFFSCAVGHGFHAAQWSHGVSGWSLWSAAIWDVLTGVVAVHYWTLRRHYTDLIGPGALYVDSAQQQRLDALAVKEQIAASRLAAEAERDTQARMLRDIVANSQSLIYVKDLDGRYLMANRPFEVAFSVREADLLGLTDAALDPVRAPVWRASDVRAREGAYHVEETSDGAGGRRIYESVKFPLYDAQDRLYATCGVSLDVTALRDAVRDAERGRDDALALSSAKSLFMATLSHEIRTPLNGLLGLAVLLRGTGLDDTQRRYADGLATAGGALLALVNDALDFAKLDAGKLILDDGDVVPAALLADVVGLLSPTARAKGLRLETRLDPRLPPAVRGDSGRLRQILLNLTGNAVKFTASGGVTVAVGPVDGPEGAQLRFEVIDTGIGVGPAYAERMFEPYVQGDASVARSHGGTGLGLAICTRLAEAMGGAIGVTSELGRGSTFWCTVPLRPAGGPGAGEPGAGAAPAVPPGAGPPAPATTAGSGRRILLVEDNEINQIVAEGFLAELGYTADLAVNGRQALDLLAGHTYAAVLMDCQMPVMDGYEATAELRRRETRSAGVPGGADRHMPVIAMTASAMADDRARCLAAGMDDFLSKPVVPELLAAAISRWAGDSDSDSDRGGRQDAGRDHAAR